MLTGVPLVAAPVVPGQPGHQLLSVAQLHVGEEVDRLASTEDGGAPAVVGDDHLLAALLVRETNWSTTHRRSLALLPWEALCTL